LKGHNSTAVTDIGVTNGKWTIYGFSTAGEFAVGSSPDPPEQTDSMSFNNPHQWDGGKIAL